MFAHGMNKLAKGWTRAHVKGTLTVSQNSLSSPTETLLVSSGAIYLKREWSKISQSLLPVFGLWQVVEILLDEIFRNDQ